MIETKTPFEAWWAEAWGTAYPQAPEPPKPVRAAWDASAAHTRAEVRELVAGLFAALTKIGVKPLGIDEKQAYVWVEGIGGDRIEELPLASYLLLSWETERKEAAARAQAYLDARPAEEDVALGTAEEKGT